MVDVLKVNVMRIAMERRANLRRDLEKLEEFIRMAESLISGAAEPCSNDRKALSPHTSTHSGSSEAVV